MASESKDRKLRGWKYLGPDASEVIKNARFNHPGFDGQQEPHGPYDGPEGERRRMREVADEMRSKMDKPKKRGRGPSGESPAKPKAITKASDESAARRLVRNVGKVARVAGPLGAAVGALAASDPLEAVGMPVDKAGAPDDWQVRTGRVSRKQYEKEIASAKADRDRRRDKALERMGVKPNAKAPKVKSNNPMAKYGRGK